MISPRFIEIISQLKTLHERKNAGYSGEDNPDPWANFRHSMDIGVPASKGAIIRMCDKIERIKSLTRLPSNEQVGEDITTTLADVAAYAIITICLLEEEGGPKYVVEGVSK